MAESGGATAGRAGSQPVAEGSSLALQMLIAAIIVVAVLIVYVLAQRVMAGRAHFTIDKTKPVVSEVDGAGYKVHDNADAQKAADTLAALNRRVIDLMRHLRRKYARGADGDLYPARRSATERLLTRYNPDNIFENSPKDPGGDTAYVLEKGAVIAICLRPKNGEANSPIHDLETLTFVTLHEMSHIAIDSEQHLPEFWEAFKFILLEAEEAGLFVSPDYANNPVVYCGLKVDYSPRWDPATDPIS